MALCSKKHLVVICVLTAIMTYYIVPVFPDSASNHWLKIFVGMYMKFIQLVSNAGSLVGMSPINIMRTLLQTSALFNRIAPNVEKNTTAMDGVEVTIYRISSSSNKLSPGIIHYHGGGWALLSPELYNQVYIDLVQQTQAVLVAVNYRLAPEHLFPIPLEDCLRATRYFLRHAEHFGVDRNKIGVKGDSAGGNLAMAAAIQLAKENDLNMASLKFMSLDYPALQAYDFNLPCHQKYGDGPGFLTKNIMVSFWLNYGFGHLNYFDMFINNSHIGKGVATRFSSYVNSEHLPDEFKIGLKLDTNRIPDSYYFTHYMIPEDVTKVVLDPKFAPLMASDKELRLLPTTHVMNAEIDVLRDEGFILVKRLRNVGVSVDHRYVTTEEHGFLNLLGLDRKYAFTEIIAFAEFFNRTINM